jgi:lysophospholipase L1-like esterase
MLQASTTLMGLWRAMALLRFRQVLPALVACCAMIGTARPVGSTAAEHWVGTWAAAPQPFMPGALETFHDQSVRLIVYPSIGGSKLRVRISNIYGAEALKVGAVHIARVGNGAEIRSDTDRTATFGGKAATTIDAGREATSDPVDLDVPAAGALAITMFFPHTSPATTTHFLALQTSYVSSQKGDFTAAEHFPVEKTITSWPFLTGVDVVPRTRSAAVVVFGDSTVDGDGSTANTNRRWSDWLARRLRAEGGTRISLAVLNEGIIGNRLLRNSPHQSEFGDALGEAGVARFTRDVLQQAGVTAVIVRIGVNDLGFPAAVDKDAEPVTAGALIDGYRKLISFAHAHGVRIFGTTIGPFEGVTTLAGYYTSEKETVRQQVNAWLRQRHELDGLTDIDRVLRDPHRPSRLLPAYDSGDHLHPNDAGYAACAEAVDLAGLVGRRP